MLHGLANGVFLDDKRFWPIYERAQALDVPIYLHPSVPLPAVDWIATVPLCDEDKIKLLSGNAQKLFRL